MSTLRAMLIVIAVAACGGSAKPAAHRAGTPADATPTSSARPEPRLSPQLVLDTVTARYLPHLRRCYVQQIKRDERAGGRVTLSFTVAASGRVTSASASGVARRLSACIERGMVAWEFAPSRGETSFRIPLELRTN
jgi:hypothetical protein